MHRRDTFELSLLALGLLGWALVVAPLVHAVSHGHSYSHAHGSLPTSSSHGDGSFEHHRALIASPPAMPVVPLVLLAMNVREAAAPRAPFVRPHRISEQPQGP